MLAKQPSEIKLNDIIRVVEGTISPVDCVYNTEICSRSDTCVTREVWSEIKSSIDNILDFTTLQDLVDRQIKREESEVGQPT